MVQPVEGIRAATQRAPVEQGRESQSCPKCAARERVKALFDRKWNKANPEIVSVDEVQEALAGVDLRKAAAPDHAREGALFLCRYRDSEGKECGAPIALNVYSYSGFTHAEGSGWLHWASPVRYGPQDSKAVFVKRADGKEGGE